MNVVNTGYNAVIFGYLIHNHTDLQRRQEKQIR